MARWLTTARDRLSRTQTVMVAAVEAGVPHLTAARDMITAFQTMIRRKTANSFEPCLMQAKRSPLASFANGIAKDQAAVLAAITSPWSNGQVEGQITKLKMIKRQDVRARQAGPARSTPWSMAHDPAALNPRQS